MTSAFTHFSSELLCDISQFVTVGSMARCVGIGGIFIYIQILMEISIINSADPDQLALFAASDLGLYCLPMSRKMDARLT